MSLRFKLLLAFTPLFAAVLIVSIAGAHFLGKLGKSSQEILRDNYRTVLAIQHIHDSLEQLDESALLRVAGKTDLDLAKIEFHRRRFEEKLRFQESNISEKGEAEATVKLRRLWENYSGNLDHFWLLPKGEIAAREYFAHLMPIQKELRSAADFILTMNQDAIVRKSERTKKTSEELMRLLVLVSCAGVLVALYASLVITKRLMRPLSVLSQATRRLGEGDVMARARVEGSDEVAQLAKDFNTMADRLQHYRESSVGELMRAERASQATIDSLADPVMVLDADARIVCMNRAAEQLFKVTKDQGLEAFEPRIRDLMNRFRNDILSGKSELPENEKDDEPIRLTTPEGERYFSVKAMPVVAQEGDVTGVTIIFEDITRLLRFEELRNNLVATVAHEFRTPLTSLQMAIHLLTQQQVGSLNDKQADLVYAAREECGRLQATVNELLDLSRIQAGRIELVTKPIEAEILASEAIEAQEGLARQKQVNLRNEILPGTGEVLVDPERIALVFANLISNAIKHSPQKSQVRIRAFPSEQSLRFEVMDSGRGIPEEYHEVIFEKYFRVPSEKPGGAGLGLFIAKEIVQAHNGKIGVESVPGEGSTFWFTLPRNV